ncbi:PREDICTED: protein phosphatase 1 regulatory subunit 15A [Chrysochloris asiatica]|uniref:Protein phosphatase 1 regulatory subunit 15A n=1 Tax=Chrysochloris asiatica TaxID=185453 RepID=A0A9B0TVC5_CHRAS|nr:PREDICTED: protein phosphatase 1 regulatory subunit 15A [Chrysochloris asiatica]
MAPGQASPLDSPWRNAHPFFLLSPLVGLLSRAWSRLKGPGPPESWLLEAVTEEAALEEEVETSLAFHHATWGKQPLGEAEDSGAAEKGEADMRICPARKANSYFLDASNVDDEAYTEKEATSVAKEQESELTASQAAPLPPSLLRRTLQHPLGEEESEEDRAADNTEMTKAFSYPPSPWESYPGPGEKEDKGGEVVKRAASRPSSPPLSPDSQLSTWVCCPGEGEEEKDRTAKNKEVTKTAMPPSCSGSNPKTWECCSGESKEERDRDTKEIAEKAKTGSEAHSAKSWEYQPKKRTEEEDEEDGASWAAEEEGEPESPSPDPSTSAFLKAWVYRPGEDTEEEEEDEDTEDSDSEAPEEEGVAEGPSSSPCTSAFLKAWVYRPGEDTEEEEEDDTSWAAEEEGEPESPSPNPCTSAFLKAWVYQPGEDTEEEEDYEGNEDGRDDSEAADSGPHPFQSALRTWISQVGEDTEEEEWEEAEPCPLRVVFYLPGEKPPASWAPPRLPLRLQQRLKCLQTPAWNPDPEIPQKATKVRFAEKVSVHHLVVWAGPAQAARRGPWEQLARDRSRFACRIARAQEELGPCLSHAARARAWARLGNPPLSLAPISVPTQTTPASSCLSVPSLPSTHLNPTVATPSSAPGPPLGERRG